MNFKIKLYDNDSKLIPVKSFPSDAGFDLKVRAFCKIADDGTITSEEMNISWFDCFIGSNERLLIKTGVFIELKEGWEAQVRSRSGMALKHGVFVLNSPGTVDALYRNEIGVILYNSSVFPFTIKKYDRIAQLVIKKVPEVSLTVADELDVTDRNLGGFGSTGK